MWKGFAARTSGPDASNAGPDIEERVYGLRAGMEVSRWLHEMPKPTLAVIPGAAAGAGLSLALACDLRIAAERRQADHRLLQGRSLRATTAAPTSLPT